MATEPKVILITDPEARARLDPELEWLSRLMDNMFVIPGLGWRFGLDPLLGLIPGVGDVMTSLVSVYILSAAVRYQVPRVIVLRMTLNIVIDYLGGAVPLVGDVFDVWWKSNQKNIELLKQSIDASGAQRRRGRAGDWLFVGAIGLALIILLAGIAVLTYTLVRWVAGVIFGRYC